MSYIQTINRTKPGAVNLFTYDQPLVAGRKPIPRCRRSDLVDAMGVPMIQIPAGEFIMGSERGDEDVPPHPVYLDSYAIDQYEVTNQLFVKFLNQYGNQDGRRHQMATDCDQFGDPSERWRMGSWILAMRSFPSGQ